MDDTEKEYDEGFNAVWISEVTEKDCPYSWKEEPDKHAAWRVGYQCGQRMRYMVGGEE